MQQKKTASFGYDIQVKKIFLKHRIGRYTKNFIKYFLNIKNNFLKFSNDPPKSLLIPDIAEI